MIQTIESTGKTVESAVIEGARKLGVDRNSVSYEILEMPKKGFLGFGEVLAKVRVSYEAAEECSALEFVKQLIKDMELEATASVSDIASDSKIIRIDGGDCGLLIGHHGETLDALQYLVNLVANKCEDEEDDADEDNAEEAAAENEGGEKKGKKDKRKYTRYTVDIENYRAKREETLRSLARKKANAVMKYKKPITLEPMPPYERRIIHSEIQTIRGVYTKSVGNDNNRRIVISPDAKTAARTDSNNGGSRPNRGGDRNSNARPKSDSNKIIDRIVENNAAEKAEKAEKAE